MKISPTYYNDAGELMAPHPADVNISNTLGGLPTLDAGFYHLFTFMGRTQAEYQDKYARFASEMGAVPGFMQLTVREYKVEMGNFVRYGVDILYAVETADGVALLSHYDWTRLKYAPAELDAFIQRVQQARSVAGVPSKRPAPKSSAPSMIDIIVGKR